MCVPPSREKKKPFNELKPTALRINLCVHIYSLAYIVSLKKKKITQGLSVYKNKGEQSILNGTDAMKRVYLNLVWSFSSDHK